ncbi:MAG: radical SAM family heme chaperone HemW [Capsulimonas sp.]|uniref:radical SAM family heme chaperone HemW n=1 Tax=Capsulimonas sp. TaxID=2494211 RepID=UPI003265ECEC
MTPTIGCYVHIPFCVRKCAYCDFNSYSGYTDGTIRRYVDALTLEIERAPVQPQAVDTIFFGGGTPTAIPATDEAALLRAVLDRLPVAPDAEITTEANPGTMDVQHLEVLREAGFNRISFGVQSFDSNLLKTLDRIHSADEAKNAVKAARAAGFDNVSIDLMFALPRQTKTQWRDTLDQAMALETEHISLYSLIVEEGTGFYTLRQKGRLPLPDEDTAAEMFQMAIDAAHAGGYEQYEISNFAKPGRACSHNIHYWRNDPYYGFGCGAVGYLDGKRLMNIKSPAKYCETIEEQGDLTYTCEELTAEETMAETMMLGLRLTGEGVDCRRYAEKFGVDPRVKFREDIAKFTKDGLLETVGDSLRLTPHGVFLANEVMMAFV